MPRIEVHYMDPRTDPHEVIFSGMEKKQRVQEHGTFPEEQYVECPRCLGYGGWHLRIDAYGPEKHFNAGCFECRGWGYVRADSVNCSAVRETGAHTWVEYKHDKPWRCWHELRCTACGRETSYDSSD